VGQKEASSSAVRHLVSRFFGGSPGELVLRMLEEEAIDVEELERIKKKIGESKK
jgi:hypothetical protein